MQDQDTNTPQENEEITPQDEWLTQESTTSESDHEEIGSSTPWSSAEREAYLRLKADYDNLVKRHERERDDMKKFFTTHIVKKLLPAYDTISRITEHSTSDTSSETLLAGVQSAKDIFEKSLSSVGVTRFESVGCEVDPSRHDVMSQGPGPKDTIIADFESGFILDDESIVRHAKVVVGLWE